MLRQLLSWTVSLCLVRGWIVPKSPTMDAQRLRVRLMLLAPLRSPAGFSLGCLCNAAGFERLHAEPMKFNDALVAVLVASISPTKFPGVLQGGLPMIYVILTTLSVIATGAGALVAMWLVVSILYTLGCVMFGWEKPPRRYIPPPP